MRRVHKNPFEPVVRLPPPALGFKPAPAPRVPQHFIEAMKRISATPDMASQPQPQKGEDASVDKWKSSFQPIDKQNEKSEDKSPGSETRTELYDPNDPLSSDSEAEMSQLPPAVQNSSQRCKRPSPDRDARRWESSTAAAASRPLERRTVPQTSRPTDSQDLNPGHVLDRPGYEFPTGHLEARIHSPDRLSHGSSSQAIPESFRGLRTNGGERKPLPDYPREMAAPLRVSPPRLKREHQQLGYVERGLDQEAPPPKLTRTKGENTKLNKCPITCDLCDVELSNAQELEEHLDSRTHWDTLEHIQRSSSYDDMAIAFLQEVMVYKSQHCSRAVEEDALPGLQENHHMTKVEMLHCAACKVHVSTSAAEVQAHVSSLEHLTNTKGFEAQQRHSCLSKAEAMLKKLQPQFELFLRGACPFE
ncbi:uncharacterized protein LOC122840559 isoform X2 [Gambusia affinis]|uniref:uncharacterized protein LOC122840559 isoform X2 n=1 Tax=Gambusia affinis TaxID=33528 RepID=UPI001CDCD0DD|nr:uncharacterized protein LOC122840559 isoform X2 [Gambusia affinis]